MMKINFDSSNKTPQPWTIVLCKRNKDRMGQLHNITDLRGSFNLNSAQELSFTLHKELNGVEERLWDEVYNLKIIWVKELDTYFQIEVDVTDSKVDNIKNITATSLCEAELSQIMLHDIQINETEDIESFTILHPEMSDEEVREACQIKFWNKEYPERSLLYKVLHDKAPHYTIKHVDESLAGLQRTFTIDGTSIYDWLVGDCSEQFDCIFEFDSRDRSISAYDLFSVCENDNCSYYIETGNRYRENFNDFCPKCGSRKIHVYGHDTGIIVDKNNLTEEVQLTTDVDSIKNTFRLVAGDDTMTVAVQGINPNGSDYLYYFSEEMYHDMSDDLAQALRDYETKQESYEEEYSQIMLDMYDNLDETAELVHVRMPSYEIADMNAESEADILNNSDLSVIGFTSVSVPPSESTVNRAIEQYAKCFIHSGFFKVEAVNVTYTPSDLTWRGQLKISNYNNEYQGVNGNNIDDTAYTNYFTSTLVGADINATSYEKYIQQKCDKIIANDIKNERDINVFNILKFYITPEYFRDHIGDYCLNRLTDFRDSLQSCIDVMQIEVASANTNTEEGRKTLEIYKRYYDKLIYLNGGYLYDDTNKNNYIDGKIPEYEIEKTRLESEYASLVERQKEIQAELNFKNHLDSYNANLYEEFCSFRREDVYQNNNYISDYYVKNYDNAGLFENARLFLKEANKQIRISAEYQHSISTNLYNLLLMEEFDPLIDNFELGNFIRVRVEDDIYRLRLIHYEVDFSDLSTLNTDFSDMTKTGNSLNDVKSILDSAQQMATSYGYIEKQAEKGTVAYGTLEDFRRDGLLSALYKINNNVNEEITFDHRGIMAKSYDDITDSYLDKQLRITHNILAFTKDNWRTVSLALGNFNYYDEDGVWREGYGINADFCISSYIQGSTIVGGKIMSPYDTSKYKNHMTILDLTNGDFKIGNQTNGLEYTNSTNTLSLYGGTFRAANIIGGSFSSSSGGFWIHDDGTFNFGSGNSYISYNGSNITFGSGVVLSWDQVSDQPDIPTDEDISTIATTITNNSIATARIRADQITAGTLSSDVIFAGSISADRIQGGSLSGVNLTIGGTYSWGTGGRQIPMFYVNSDGTTIIKRIISNQISLTNGGTRSVEIYNSGYEHVFGVMNIDGGTAVDSRITTELICTMGTYFNKLKNDGSGTYEDEPVYEPQQYYNPVIGFREVYIGSGYSPGIYSDGYGEIGNLRDVKYLVETYSDKRVKENINTLSDITDNYMKLSPVKFNFITNTSIKKDWDYEYGLIAQDVEKVFPELIGKSNPLTSKQKELCGDYIYSLNYNGLHALHIQMIQKQQHEIDSLKEEIEQLKEMIKNK